MKNKIEKRKRLKRRTIRLSIHFLAWIGIAVLYYIVFSLFFDTPIEYEIRKSNRQLDVQYKMLSQRYDSLLQVVDNITQRDKNVYNMLFESEPFSDSNQGKSHLSIEKLLGMTNNQLAALYLQKAEAVIAKGKVETDGFIALTRQMQEKGSALSRIPSIQPVNNRELTKLATSYGMRINPFHKVMMSHQGVDFALPENTRVYATADGVVSQTSTSSSQGQGVSLTIDHQNGYKTVYAHLNKLLVRSGSNVKRGDIIAYSGNSGLSFVPHLHYEVISSGRRVDPLFFFFQEMNPYTDSRLQNIASMGMQSLD